MIIFSHVYCKVIFFVYQLCLQEIELGLKLLELAGFLAEMCKPVGGSNTISYPLAQVRGYINIYILH